MKITGLVGGIRDFDTMIKIGFKYIEYLKDEFSKLDSNGQFFQEVDISEGEVSKMIKKIKPSYDKTWNRFLDSFRVLKSSGIITANDGNDEFKKRYLEKHQQTGYTIHIHHVCLSLLKSFNNEKEFAIYVLENFKNSFGCKIFEKIKLEFENLKKQPVFRKNKPVFIDKIKQDITDNNNNKLLRTFLVAC